MNGPPQPQGPPGPPLVPPPPGYLNGHGVPAPPGAPSGGGPPTTASRPPQRQTADEIWAARPVSADDTQANPGRRAAWFAVIALVLLGGMLLGARGCAKALTDGDLAALRKEPIAAAPPGGTEVHRAASLGGGKTLPYIERVFAVPDRQAAIDHYTSTYGASFYFSRSTDQDGAALSGGRPNGKRQIGVRVDIRDVAAGPRLVEATPDSLKPTPPGTLAYVTVVLSATSGSPRTGP
jgi:hypothetical protein